MFSTEDFESAWDNKFTQPNPLSRAVKLLENKLGHYISLTQLQKVFELWGHDWTHADIEPFDHWDEIEEKMDRMTDDELIAVVAEFTKRYKG